MSFKRILNFVTVLVTLTVNGLANALPLNGQNTGDISNRFPVLFTPAGYVFSIWGVIYLGLLAFGIYQLLPSQKNNPRLEKLGYWFILSNVFNSAWIFAWHYNLFPLSLVIMLGLLLSLVVIYLRLQIGISPVSTREMWLVNIPFSIYLGWISVATIANFSVVLYNAGWNGSGFAAAWTVLVLAVGTALGIAMIFLRNEVAFPAVLVWAFAGIWQKQSSLNAFVAVAAGLAALIVLAALLYKHFVKKSQPQLVVKSEI
jgi:translocator protein